MKNIRKTYDILSIILICVWVVSLIIYQTVSVEFFVKYPFAMIILIAVISYLYAFSVIGLLIYLGNKGKIEHAMNYFLICLIIPFITFIVYFVAIRKVLKDNSKE